MGVEKYMMTRDCLRCRMHNITNKSISRFRISILLIRVTYKNLLEYKFQYYRLKVALSCLFEDGDKEANRLARRINSLISTLKAKLTLLTNDLNQKISTFQTSTFYQESDCTLR